MTTRPQLLADEQFAELFFELVERPEDERARRLGEISREDAEQAAELASLLNAHHRQPGRFEATDPECAASLLLDDDEDQVPEQVGPFRLVAELGRGGIGVVYLGERSKEGFEQQAAIKLIKRGMDSTMILDRFRVERRILASLKHPNIAALIDGGMLPDGRPWFAMEYIEGEPLTEWCERQRCTLDERLDLFEQVCAAVQHAHTRLIIHRDIKPANILVTDHRVVKLLDFGIAKLLAEDDQPDSPMTQMGLRAMTPEYAAPEQIRREPVSTATDVHALGVVLFELLIGEHPFRHPGTSREQMIRAICETSPGVPSGRIEGERALALARQMNLRPAVLRRRLRGDLDTIVSKAMAKEPARRYSTVHSLVEDLQRFRSGLPIRARRDSVVYRARRFVSRHRVGVAATAAVIIALLAGMIGVWQQAHQTALEARRAERSLDFLTSLFQSGDPRIRQPVDSIDELLDEGAERASSELTDDPVLQGTVLLRLAEVRMGRAEPDEGRVLADRALGLLQAQLREPDRRLADALRVAGGTRYAMRQYEQSEPIMRAAAAQYRALNNPARAGEAMSAVAGMLRDSEGYQAGLDLQRSVVTQMVSELGPDHPAVGPARSALGIFAIDAGEFDLADRELRLAIEHAERRGLDGELDRAENAVQLGSLLDRMGRSEEAEPWFQISLSSYIKLLGDDAAPVVNARFALGLFQLGQRKLEDAESQFRQVIQATAISPTTRGHGHRYLGITLTRQGRLAEAMDELTRAQSAYREIDGVSTLEQAWRAQADFGHAQILGGNAESAVATLSEAVAGIEAIRGQESYNLIQPLSYQALALEQAGQREEAIVVAKRAIATAEHLLGSEHRLSRETRERHSGLLQDISRPNSN